MVRTLIGSHFGNRIVFSPRRLVPLGLAAAWAAMALTSSAQTYSWNTTSSSNWNNTANWSGGAVPNIAGAYVIDAKTTTLTTTLDISPTVGVLCYYNRAGSTTWTISSSASGVGSPFSITMNNSGGSNNPWGNLGAAIVSISKGHFTVNPNIVMTGDLYAGTAGTSQANVIINGNITSSSANPQTLYLRTDTNGSGGFGTFQSNGSIGATGNTINILYDLTGGTTGFASDTVTLSGPLSSERRQRHHVFQRRLDDPLQQREHLHRADEYHRRLAANRQRRQRRDPCKFVHRRQRALIFNHTDSFTYPGTISGTGSLIKNGSGNLSLSGSNTYTGSTTISSGSLTIDTTVGNITLPGRITGSAAGGLTKIGPNALVLTSTTSNFTGNIVVSNGTLQAAGNDAFGGPSATSLGNLTSSGRTITVNSGGVLQCTIPNALGPGGSTVSTPLTINAGGLVTTNDGDNNNLGPVTLSGGTLSGASGGASGNFLTWQLTGGSVAVNTAPSLIVVSGATNPGLNMATTTTFNVGLTGTAGTVSGNPDLTVAANLGDLWGNVQGTGGTASSSLVKIRAGTMLLASSDSYSGTTLVSSGALVLGNTGALGLSTFDTSGAGTLSFGTLSSAFFGGLQGASGTIALTNAAGSAPIALTVGTNNNSTICSGAISDASLGGSLTKIGTGTLTLAGNNTYSGPTTVSNGALALSGSLGNTSVTVASGTTLSGGSNSNIGGSVTVNGGGALTLAVANSATPLTVGNGLTLGNSAGGYAAGNYATLTYTVSSNGTQPVNLGGSALTVNSGGVFVNVSFTTTPPAGAVYPLINFGSQNVSGPVFSRSDHAGRDEPADRQGHVQPGGRLQCAATSDRRPAHSRRRLFLRRREQRLE